MSTTLYHFSGTGNTLKIAEDLADSLGGTELVPLARATDTQLAPDTDAVGVVFPVYAWGPPAVVARFLDRVRIGPDTYVFAVCTAASSAGGALRRVGRQLAGRGIALSSGFIVFMPTNYIVWREALPVDRQQAMFETARTRVAEICSAVKERKVMDVETGGLFSRILTNVVYRASMRAFRKMDRRFKVGATCNACGLCERVCQVENIRMADGRPTWLHNCEQCLACLHWCPQEAIQVGKKTEGRTRYHHPEVKASALARRSSRDAEQGRAGEA